MSDSQWQKPISGTITAAGQTVDLTSPNSATSIVEVVGTWVGTLVVEGSNDGVTFYTVTSLNRATNSLTTAITASGAYDANTNGFQSLQIRASAWTSGTAWISVYGSDAASLINTVGYVRGATDGSLVGNSLDRLKTADGLREGGTQGALSLTTGNTQYEAKVGASRLANRKSLTITALDDMYWGYNNTVTTATGTPLYKNQQIVFAIDPDSTFQVWIVASANGKTARITEST